MGNCFFGVKDRPLPILLILRIFLPGASGKSCRVAVLGSGGGSRIALVKKWVKDNFRGSRLPSLEAIYRLVDAFARTPDRNGNTSGVRCFFGGHRFCFSLSRAPVIILVYTPNKKPTMDDMKPICELIREIQSHNLCHRFAVLLMSNPSNAPAAAEREGGARGAPRNAAGGEEAAAAAAAAAARARDHPQNMGQRPGADGRAAVESPEKAHRSNGHDKGGKAAPSSRGHPK